MSRGATVVTSLSAHDEDNSVALSIVPSSLNLQSQASSVALLNKGTTEAMNENSHSEKSSNEGREENLEVTEAGARVTKIPWKVIFLDLWRISWPLVITFTLELMPGLTNVVAIGHLGQVQLAAVTLGVMVRPLCHKGFFAY